MAEVSKIEWTDATFNPWIGCTKVGPGCDHCYAEKATPSRTLGVVWGPKAERHRTSKSNWAQPLRWEREHEAFMAEHGRRRRVFCASLADVFDNQVDPEWRRDLLNLIELTPNLDWLLVTKRIGNVADMVRKAKTGDWLQAQWNVWLGITVVSQEEADRDIPKLLDLPAHVRFLSMEPLLGPMDISRYQDWLGRSEGGMWCPDCPEHGVGVDPEEHLHCHGEVVEAAPYDGIDWVIVGGESGPQARPMHPDWARSLRDQCAAAGVPFLFKQNGEWVSVSEVAGEGPHHYFEDGATVRRIGKKAAGRLLDGVEHNGFPGRACAA